MGTRMIMEKWTFGRRDGEKMDTWTEKEMDKCMDERMGGQRATSKDVEMGHFLSGSAVE